MLRAAQSQVDAAGDVDWPVSVDVAVVRAHQRAAGARKGGSTVQLSDAPEAA
ncbi:hypothetical protein AB0G54_23670 [Streptomyces yokosukanensis]